MAPEDFVSPTEAVERLGFDVETVEAFVESGDLGSVRVRDERLVPVAALGEFQIPGEPL